MNNGPIYPIENLKKFTSTAKGSGVFGDLQFVGTSLLRNFREEAGHIVTFFQDPRHGERRSLQLASIALQILFIQHIMGLDTKNKAPIDPPKVSKILKIS